MTGISIAVLLGLSVVLLLPASRTPAQLSPPFGCRFPGPGGAGNRQQPRQLLRRFRRFRPDPALQDMPLLIHQLTGLLAAGRAPHQLWADAAALQTGNGAESSSSLSARLLPVLEAAAQAASLGLSPVPVFQAAAQDGAEVKKPRKGRRTADAPLPGLWTELAACVSVSERSGAPLAGVLGRYAAALEVGLDNQAARETAMAGPQATVRLLTWLPAGGMGLGYLLGADPVGILLGSPVGWLAGAAGVVLALIGRVWSRALVRQAAGT
ncbi:tight adherence protein B [Arthrobacter sp. UYP6]|uniref:type II secretion system F family protein n=1 Tax=Arthrobacter sp. UYP6 TaxID=1756378 RepID=UPI00339B4A23